MIKIGFLVIVLSALTGCASRKLEQTSTVLKQRPLHLAGARIAMENIRFSVSHVPPESQVGMGYGVGSSPSVVVTSGSHEAAANSYSIMAERRFYDMLRQMSEGKVSSSARSEYEFEEIRINTRIPDQKIGEAVSVRTASFFLPPLANVKTQLECPWEISYVLRKGDDILKKNRTSGVIKGSYKGWYVAGAVEGRKLSGDLIQAVEEEMATWLLNELYEAAK